MNEVIDFLTANTMLAYIIAIIIFIVTGVMLLRRIIGVVITVVLLLLALFSGLAIANHTLFREILIGFKYEPEKTKDDSYTHYKNHVNKTISELKEGFDNHKRKLEAVYDVYHTPPLEKESKTDSLHG